jgi:iron complex transport system permease protein
VGAILSMAGLSFQTIFSNSLASPYTLGVASGASLGAAVVIKFNLEYSYGYFSTTFLGAFLGALISIIFIYFIVEIKRQDRTFVMLLAGVAFTFFASSMTLLLQYIGDISHSFKLLRWTLGSLDVVDFTPVIKVFPFFIIMIVIMFYYHRELDIILYGKEFSVSKGVDIEKLEKRFFVIVSIAIGSVIAISGPIGFVGLMVPHIIKRMFPYEHKVLALFSMFGGGVFLVFCDFLTRNIISGSQMPVGIITSFLGAPFFIFLLLAKKR